jgi:hypothetical protein
MKTHTLIATMAIALSLCACDHDAEVALRPSVATFSLEAVSFFEKDDTQDVVIDLSKPAAQAGSLSVGVESEAINHFEIVPAPQNGIISIAVPQGGTSVKFTVRSIDNQTIDGTKLVNFTLLDASRGLQVGAKNRLSSTWLDDESPARVSFALAHSTQIESASTGSVITLTLSHAVPGDGTVEIHFNNDKAAYGRDFMTHPDAVNNTLMLPVQGGATNISFTIDPLNDALFNADRTVTFTINSVSSVFEKGLQLSHELTITDDELTGRARAYYTQAGGGWSSKKTIFYTLEGSVDRISWENQSPGSSTGAYVYHYDNAGLIESVTKSSVTYVKYIREHGRIVKAEEYDNNELDRYTLYGYDDVGNIGEVAIYDRQSDGRFVFSLDFVFLYYADGNLYKKLAYNPVEDGEPVWLSTDTYENYIDAVNPFPLEIVYGQPIQNKLPSNYRHENGEKVLDYSFSYEFLPGNRPSRRTATGPSTSETTVYEYY